MTRSNTPSLPPEAARRRASGWLALLAGATMLLALGCVTKGTHDEVVAERDLLQRQHQLLVEKAGHLEVSNASLEAERVRLYDRLEDLRVETEALEATRTTLERDVMRLAESEEELSARLEAATREADKLKSTYQGLVSDLENELQKGEIEIEQLRNGLRVGVSDEILFRSGSADLDRDGRAVLAKVAGNIAKLDYEVDVEGHTDNVPIVGPLRKQYPTNWELAAARASSVVRLFTEQGIPGERLQAISRAEFDPKASNKDAEGRMLNRRIEIRLRPRKDSDLRDEPLAAAKGDASADAKPQKAEGEKSQAAGS